MPRTPLPRTPTRGSSKGDPHDPSRPPSSSSGELPLVSDPLTRKDFERLKRLDEFRRLLNLPEDDLIDGRSFLFLLR